uniref:Uncharacterized protein n=1 Tax=Phaselicystis flava TaxID=525924 RepID=A0A3S7V078_9BACT|nr:hypothetical protein [Phaselicystis flava]
MSSTDENRPADPAEALFDEVVVPLAEGRRAKGEQAYFPLGRDPGATSYYEVPARRVMAAADFEFPAGGSAVGLVDALAAHWAKEGELALAEAAPRLKEIVDTLQREGGVASDGDVSVLCYTMF